MADTQVPPPCQKLRTKDQFYKDSADLADDAEQQKLIERLYGTWDARAFWCEQTQTDCGPDDRPVDQSACSIRGRSCFVKLTDL